MKKHIAPTMTAITTLYDNYGYAEGFSFGWGFSALVKKEGKLILFDFGEAWEPLKKNMELAGVNPEEIDIAVLSHDHWDHNGGLEDFMRVNGHARIFLPAGFGGSEVFDAPSWEGNVNGRKVLFIRDGMELALGVFTSGSLPSDIGLGEQALGIMTDKGIVALVGCSHPGVDELVESLRDFGDVYAVIGGFHGFDRLEYLKGFELVVPTHCTKKRKEIMEMLGPKALPGGAGFSMEF